MTVSGTFLSSKTIASIWSTTTRASFSRRIISSLWAGQQCNRSTLTSWIRLTRLIFIWVFRPESTPKVSAMIALMSFSSPQSPSLEAKRSSAETLPSGSHRPTRLSSRGALPRQALHSPSWIESMRLSRRARKTSSTSLSSVCRTSSEQTG